MDDKDGDKKSNRRSKDFLSPDAGKIEKSPSLQRLHAQSSTETSGLGETITSGFSSQESIHSVRSGTARIKDELERDEGIATHAENQTNTPRNEKKFSEAATVDMPDKKKQTVTKTIVEKKPTVAAPCVYEGETNFDQLFLQNEIKQNQDQRLSIIIRNPSPTQGLHIQQIDKEWDRRSSIRSSIKSLSSGGNRSRSGSTSRRSAKRFLGKSTESAWMKWSRERRASYHRRIQLLEKPESAEPQRASTPVKKARQEGLKFIHPDLEGKYLTEDDIQYIRQHRLQRIQTYSVIEKSRKIPLHSRTEVQLSPTDWHTLSYFWEHVLFIRSRYFAILFNFISLIFTSLSVSNGKWISTRSNGEYFRQFITIF